MTRNMLNGCPMNFRLIRIAAAAFAVESPGAPARPNIVVILSDDQGYADIGINPRHPPEVSTPHMDALAREGVIFTQAYTSGNVCSPTRAGLMLGRYQQRAGIYTGGDGGRGMDPAIPIFPAMLPADYVSTALGKWKSKLRPSAVSVATGSARPDGRAILASSPSGARLPGERSHAETRIPATGAAESITRAMASAAAPIRASRLRTRRDIRGAGRSRGAGVRIQDRPPPSGA